MILIVIAHPYLKRSHANKQLLAEVSKLQQVVIDDLYERYADFHIDVKAEQKLLNKAKLVIFQFPIYWYNVPALLKQWQEVVLTRGFAFGHKDEDTMLKGKFCFAVVTAGHKRLSYQDGGDDCYALEDFLRPLEQLAYHCDMHYYSPLALYQAHLATTAELRQKGDEYRQRLQELYSLVNC